MTMAVLGVAFLVALVAGGNELATLVDGLVRHLAGSAALRSPSCVDLYESMAPIQSPRAHQARTPWSWKTMPRSGGRALISSLSAALCSRGGTLSQRMGAFTLMAGLWLVVTVSMTAIDGLAACTLVASGVAALLYGRSLLG